MKKGIMHKSRVKPVLLTVAAFLFFFIVILPITFSLFSITTGNVALIPVEGIITADGSSFLGGETVSSKAITQFITEADHNDRIKALVIEINSPGGSAVASDEIATALKRTAKPSIAVIREMGASGGYWIASAADHIVAHRMSMTGSIGVTSSYLEFSGLMRKYGIAYEQLTTGEFKDLGTPYRKLEDRERQLLQKKMEVIHDFFVDEIAENRQLSRDAVASMATGEFYLGTEAMDLGLVDQLGDLTTAEAVLKEVYGLPEIEYALYQQRQGIFQSLTGVVSRLFFKIGEGFGAVLLARDYTYTVTLL